MQRWTQLDFGVGPIGAKGSPVFPFPPIVIPGRE